MNNGTNRIIGQAVTLGELVAERDQLRVEREQLLARVESLGQLRRRASAMYHNELASRQALEAQLEQLEREADQLRELFTAFDAWEAVELLGLTIFQGTTEWYVSAVGGSVAWDKNPMCAVLKYLARPGVPEQLHAALEAQAAGASS